MSNRRIKDSNNLKIVGSITLIPVYLFLIQQQQHQRVVEYLLVRDIPHNILAKILLLLSFFLFSYSL